MQTKASVALDAILEKRGRGGAKAMAFRIGVTESAVSRWRCGGGLSNEAFRRAIENETCGKVKADDWAKAVRL